MKNVYKVIACKTKHLGFKLYACKKCKITKKVFFTCKSRFCSSCGKKQTDQWINFAINTLPNTKWQHITFTLPDSLWSLFWYNRHLFGLISPIAPKILQQIAEKKKISIGIMSVLHTFGRDIKRNVHMHVSSTCGGLDTNDKWKKIYFHHAAIKEMWRHRIISLIRELHKDNKLKIPPKYNSEKLFKDWMSDLYNINWYVFLQKPCGNHIRNVKYLGKYLKRPPLSEARIEEYDGKNVTFNFLDHYKNEINRISMTVMQFIGSLVRHIPDINFRTIRYYGFLSNRTRGKLLPIVHKAVGKQKFKKLNRINWREMIWLNFGKDPLTCLKCNIFMSLSQTYYGLSPPYLLRNLKKIILS